MPTNEIQFNEKNLPLTFCQDRIRKINDLINSHRSFCIQVIPGTGLSYFLRYYASTSTNKVIFIDIFSLAALTKQDLFRQILKILGGTHHNKSDQEVLEECQEKLYLLSQTNPHVVLILNRFDHLQQIFTEILFFNIASLKVSENIVIIVTSTRPISEISSENLHGIALELFSYNYYFSPYSFDEIKNLSKLFDYMKQFNNRELRNLYDLIGGNWQLIQLVANSESRSNPLEDSFVRLHLQKIFEYLQPNEKHFIQKMILGKNVNNVPDYLLKIDFIKIINNERVFFSKLFSDYLKSITIRSLPIKEKKLLTILEKNRGEIVSSEEIFNYVWGDRSLEANTWTLNSLIYRLRNHKEFKKLGYIIQSHKKLGYSIS